MPMRAQTTPWTLTGPALDKLLLQLDADRERAGGKYESLRRRLITFFECRGCHGAEDCADDTINRVARRLDQGEIIHAADPIGYFLGVARNVAREQHAERERERRSLDLFAQGAGQLDVSWPLESLTDGPIECARRCLQTLLTADRALILAYYRGDKRVKIANRQQLANRLGLAPNALRIRACRIRQRLETCMQTCIDT